MKKFLFLLVILAHFFASHAQTADQQIANCLNKSDFFTLSKIYPHIKDSVSPFLQDMSEALLLTYFNQPEKACESFKQFFSQQQNNLNPQLATSMIYLWAENLKVQGEHQEAINLIDSYLNNYNLEEQEKYRKVFQGIYTYCKAYSPYPQSEIIKPERDIRIPLSFQQTGKKGYQSIFVPVTVKGKTHQFIFDSGAGDNLITEQFARDNQITILKDSIPMMGIKSGYGRLGYVDKLQIGGMTYTNVSFLVVPDIIPELIQEGKHETHAVLGLPFIRKHKEFQIFPHKGELIFPIKESLQVRGTNLLLDNSTLSINIESEDDEFPVQFDSGNVSSSLHIKYYLQNKEMVDTNGIRDTLRIGGFGGIDTLLCYRMPEIPFAMGESQFVMKDIEVIAEEQLTTNKQKYGVFGVNFIRKFERLTINLNHMRMEVFSATNGQFSEIPKSIGIKVSPKAYRKLKYNAFDPNKMAWEPTCIFQFKESFEKLNRQFDITKRTYSD